MNGKGSKPRPYSVSQDKFVSNWERVFGGNKPAAESGSTPQNGTKSQAE